MAKRKVGVAKSGLRKSHGDKRHMFHNYGSRSMRIYMGQAGLLDKYSNIESFKLACLARGMKNLPEKEWDTLWYNFSIKTKAEQKAYFASLRK